MNLRRRLDSIVSEGQGIQLLVMTLIVMAVLAFLIFVGQTYGGMIWQEVLALFLDPGNFTGQGNHDHDWLQILTVLMGVFLFSALLVSVFTNIIQNIAEAYEKGDNRYKFEGHILIIGSRRILPHMLETIYGNEDLSGRDILIATMADVAKLRSDIKSTIPDKKFCRRITYYHIDQLTRKLIEETCADKASMIYLTGEDNDPSHDSRNLLCLNYIREICTGPGPMIPCFLTLDMHSSLDVIQYKKKDLDNRINLEVVSTSDYTVEQALVNSDILPAIGLDKPSRRARIVIAGNSKIGRSVSRIASQLCHYPNFNGENRTRITFIDSGMREQMAFFVSNNNGMFQVCHRNYISPEGCSSTGPSPEIGDFMDLEWDFVDADLASVFARGLLRQWALDPDEELVVAICYKENDRNLSAALHLPEEVYRSGCPIMVYQDNNPVLVKEARNTGMFGNMIPFGEGLVESDSLFLKRTAAGKRVNRLYDEEYGNPPAPDEDSAWKGLSQAHKLSSIASANFMPMVLRCFGLEPDRETFDKIPEDIMETISETEHRRWMSSVLVMGYSPATKEQRKDKSRMKYLKDEKFIHLDIAPYDELKHEQKKDLLLVSNIPYILTGKK